jgi:hypothetical protein
MQQRVCQHGTTRDLAAVLVCDLSGSNAVAAGPIVLPNQTVVLIILSVSIINMALCPFGKRQSSKMQQQRWLIHFLLRSMRMVTV